MNILGVNAGRAAPPAYDPLKRRPLADGSAALLRDGVTVCATIEERHTRKRFSGGFRGAVAACLEASRVQFRDIDAIGFSTCCDRRWERESDRIDAIVEEIGSGVPSTDLRRHLAGRTHCIDHHDSHATLAFVGSGFRRCLVFVIDGFGNRVDKDGEFSLGADWWRGRFDRQTVYLADWCDGRARLDRVHEGATGADDIGVAELYRSVTHFLGWPSYQFAGKTMALAAYGDPSTYDELTLVDNGPDSAPRVHLRNRHDNPVGQITDALTGAGYSLPPNIRRPATPASGCLPDVAAMVQHQVEKALIEWVSAVVSRFGITRVAFSGGFALNCVAMGRVAAALPDLRIYVPPAPGDTGQGLGNALWLAHSDGSPLRERTVTAIRSAALGPPLRRRATRTAIECAGAAGLGISVLQLTDTKALVAAVVSSLLEGKMVAIRKGRSEYGPRALGQCSILFDPRGDDAKDRVNAVKRREGFRPFAASVLAPFVRGSFEFAGRSPFMSFAPQAREAVRHTAPGVVHIDGSTRIQTVSPSGGFLARVLTEFHRQTGLPFLLNTSFNLSGEPMVESPEDAVDVFMRSSINTMALGDYLVSRH